MREKAVPADCTVLVVGGPDKDLLPETTGAIRDFVKGGRQGLRHGRGRAEGALPEPRRPPQGVEHRGGPGRGGGRLGDGPALRLLRARPARHGVPLAPDHQGLPACPRSTAARAAWQAGKGTVEGVSAQDLVKTSAQSWAESDLTLKDPIKFDEGKDRMGPISLAAVATVKGPTPAPTPAPSPAPSPAPEEPKAREGRVVAVGDADFAVELPPRLPGQPGLLPERGGLARRGRRPHLDPPEGAGEPGALPEPPGPAERGLDRPRPPARPLRDPGRRQLVAEAIAP